MSALQDLFSRALETESHEIDMEADAEFKELGHGQHDVFMTSPLHHSQTLSTMLIIDCSNAASVVNVASSVPVGVLLYPTLTASVASFSTSSSECSIHPRSCIFVVDKTIIVALGAQPLPHYLHAIAIKLLHIQVQSVVMLRCDDELPQALRLCSSSWNPQYAPQLNAISPMAFPHVLDGLSAAVATQCEADGIPCCAVSCPSTALSAIASAVSGASVSVTAHGQSSRSPAPPLYL
jgi:hypothetical protein